MHWDSVPKRSRGSKSPDHVPGFLNVRSLAHACFLMGLDLLVRVRIADKAYTVVGSTIELLDFNAGLPCFKSKADFKIR